MIVAIVAVLGSETIGAGEPNHFARSPSFAHAVLSTDGALLGYVEHSGGDQHVVIRRIADGAERHALALESARERVRWCGWSGPRYLLCGTVQPVRQPDRVVERTRLYAVDSANGGVRELNTRFEDPVRDQVIDLLPSRPAHVLLQLDRFGRGYPDVFELNVASGEMRLLVRSHPQVRRWMSDGRGEVRLGVGYDNGRGLLLVRERDADAWRIFADHALNDLHAIGPLSIGADGMVYVLRHHRGRAALYSIDTQAPGSAPILLFADPIFDVSGPVILHPRTRALLAVEYVAERQERHFFDADEQRRQAWLDERLPGLVNRVLDRSLDDRYQLVESASDVDPPSLYVFDTLRTQLTLLGHQYPELEGREFARMQRVTYGARDGQIIPGYLTRPRTQQAGAPAIVLPHAGPESRDFERFDPLVQFLAARGYVVLQMNYRGSFGFGAGFAAAGAGQWGGVIHRDITDGTRWLVAEGIADPERICIVGQSFGGYAALLGAARESQWYACAASFAGPSDLLALSEYVGRMSDADLWQQRLGRDSRALWQMSPRAWVRHFETPILLIHGRNDPIVPVGQSRRLAAALRKAGKPHEVIERPDCDHGMTIASCRAVFFAALDAFLAAHVGAVR